jgi:uncharacterized protein YigA (DUF484 family)
MDVSEVVRYLSEHNDFFERHPQLLDSLRVPHPQSGQAISLVERQSLLLRERIRGLEGKLAELIHHGETNDALVDKLVQWGSALLCEREPADRPDTLLRDVRRWFNVPHAALRFWGAAPAYAGLASAQPVSADILRLAASMQAPFCGSNVGFEAARWFAADGVSEKEVASVAILPLRASADQQVFGLLVLGSPDRDRFQITMGTAFLTRIAALAGAAIEALRE